MEACPRATISLFLLRLCTLRKGQSFFLFLEQIFHAGRLALYLHALCRLFIVCLYVQCMRGWCESCSVVVSVSHFVVKEDASLAGGSDVAGHTQILLA